MFGKGSILENVHVTGFSNEGKSLGRVDNFVIFIEGAVPGDTVDVEIFRKKKNYAEGKAVRLVQASQKRVNPFCQHFGVCGGCKWQHLSYESQLEFKQQQVVDSFERLGKLETSGLQPILGSERTKYYRNKLEFTFSNKSWKTLKEMEEPREETPALGFHVPLRFDKILDIQTCYLMDEINNDIRLEVKNFCIANGISFFDLREQTGEMRNLMLRHTSTGEWMVVVVFYQFVKEKHLPLLENIKTRFPFIRSLQYIVNSKKNDTIYDQEVILYHGKDHIVEEMEGLKFRISAKSFYQTNSYQAYELYKIVRNFASFSGHETVYDLYTGTGTIASFISRDVKHVFGIDYIEDAIKDARQNAKDNNLTNLTFFTGDIKETLNDGFINKHGRPDVIITDPPRAGMHEDVITSIMTAAPEKVIYVSCNPQTQARDLNLMAEQYRTMKIQPVDMFPHTSHVENVVLLVKK